jgi:hypothetical protein
MEVSEPGAARRAWLAVPFLAGGSSIASLLGYFYGWFPLAVGVATLLLPGIASIAVFVWLARRGGQRALADRVLAGLFAGGFATLAYDACRIPLVHSGLPIFKAISYFGTLLVGGVGVTPAAQLAGWTYHYSNGIGFALMYTALFARGRLWTAVLWGAALEGAMLLTPYAEVFGYTRGHEFVAITLGAHAFYGAGLWAGLRLWRVRGRLRPRSLLAGFVLPALGVAGIGADFHRAHGGALPPAPPSRMGPHLYTTWNVLEVDRVITLWLLARFEDPEAEFSLLPPFTKTPYGIPIDVPESRIRRSTTASAAEVALEAYGLRDDPHLAHLGDVATYFEIRRWGLRPAGMEIGDELLDVADACTRPDDTCLGALFDRLDTWYEVQQRPPSGR